MEGKWQEKAGLFITIDNKFEIKHFNSIAYRINAAMSKADNDQTNEGENTASFFRHGEPRTVPNNQPICLHILLLLSCHWNTIENRESRTVWWGIVLGTFSMNGIAQRSMELEARKLYKDGKWFPVKGFSILV